MPFELNQVTLIYLFAAIATILLVEALYLTLFSTTSYKTTINRRMRLMQNEPNRENILVQLRRERSLTAGGDYSIGLQSLNRLVLQSGLTIGLWKFAIIVAVAAVAFFCGLLWYGFGLTHTIWISLIATLVVPLLALKMMRSRRHKKFGAQFPDAIDVIVRSLRAGHPVPVAVQLVGRELPDPVGTEFGMVSDEITYGADLETALRNLYFRIGQDDLPLFVTAVAIQGSTGGNLSEILSNLSSVIRLRFKMRRKIKALAAEGKFSAIFLSCLPLAVFLLLNVMTPDFYGSIIKYDITKWGLGLAGAWMMGGNIVMYKMCNFRI